MIKINLAKKKQSSTPLAGGGGGLAALKNLFAGGGGGGGGMDLGALKGASLNLDSVKTLLQGTSAGQLIIPVIIAGGAWYGSEYYKEAQMQVVDAEVAAAEAEKKQLGVAVGKLKSYEEMKKSLDGDEVVLKTKIEAIKKLISERGAPIKTFVAISNAIPSEVWLSDFEMRENEVMLRGYSLKFEQISDFIKSLSENDSFTDVNLRNTQVSRDDSGMSMPSFEVAFKRKQRQGAGI